MQLPATHGVLCSHHKLISPAETRARATWWSQGDSSGFTKPGGGGAWRRMNELRPCSSQLWLLMGRSPERGLRSDQLNLIHAGQYAWATPKHAARRASCLRPCLTRRRRATPSSRRRWRSRTARASSSPSASGSSSHSALRSAPPPPFVRSAGDAGHVIVPALLVHVLEAPPAFLIAKPGDTNQVVGSAFLVHVLEAPAAWRVLTRAPRRRSGSWGPSRLWWPRSRSRSGSSSWTFCRSASRTRNGLPSEAGRAQPACFRARASWSAHAWAPGRPLELRIEVCEVRGAACEHRCFVHSA